MPADYFALPRTTRPADWFDRELPALALRLPNASLPHSAVVHVAGAGSWSQFLRDGKVVVQAGVHGPVAVQLSVTAAHFREFLFGAVRERHAKVLKKLGLPVAVPDLSKLPVDPRAAANLAAVGGSLAVILRDRDMDDAYRAVITFGSGTPAVDKPTATVEVDLDDLAALAAAKTPPLKVLTSGKLRITGDTDLPLRALTALLGRAP